MRGDRRHYRLLDVLGHGRFGVVHLARRRGTREFVAAKVLDAPNADELSRLRFLSEQSLQIDSPHVLRTRDWYQRPETAVLVMDLADHGSLDDVVALNETIPESFVESVADDALDGLSILHEGGVIHRDIKPGNVMLCSSPDGPIAKVGDLGVAIGEGRPRLTQDGAIVGTLGFVAPEVLAGEDHSVASDIWAMGRTLRELADRADPPVESVLAALLDDMTAADPRYRPPSAAAARARLLGDGALRPRASVDLPKLSSRAAEAIGAHRRRTRTFAGGATTAVIVLAVLIAQLAAPSGTTKVGTAVLPTSTFRTAAVLAPTTTVAPGQPCEYTFAAGLFSLGLISRLERFHLGASAAEAFGSDTDAYGDVFDMVTEVRQQASGMAGMQTDLGQLGDPDRQLERALVIEWLATAGLDPPIVTSAQLEAGDRVDNHILDPASQLAARLLGDPDMSKRLRAFTSIRARIEATGCPSEYPRAQPLAHPAAALPMQQATTLAEFFDRADALRAEIWPS